MKKRVLVVDDEPDFLEVIRVRLESNDCDVVTVTNGDDALKTIKGGNIDVVLLDILMPGMDGLEVLKKIRKLDKDLPVYIITAFSTEERFKMANKFGASGFIVKTDDLREQIKSISSVIDMSDKYRNSK
ncbi:MAG: response regulator [Candidatus Omnitrophota bacterium]|jgi:DNA-binding NtrC family response regulator